MKKSQQGPEETKDMFETEFKQDYISDWDVHKQYIVNFNPHEAMLIGKVYDSVSNSIDGSKITDSYAATLSIERAARVMGKLPDGVTEPIAKADEGKAAFMDIIRQKWIYPNANAQHPFETKLRLWQLYSDVYGYMPMFYDWNVSPSGYVGPDCWLWNPRNLVPQQGKVSLYDMDYVTALTWVSKKYLKDMLDKQSEGDGWKPEALKLLIEKAAQETTENDQDKDTEVSRDRTAGSVKKGICLATRYEAGENGEWITFAPDHAFIEVRRLKNPHKNGRIPFVIKYSLPLMDSFYGLGDFQRAKPLQFARDGLTNFYFASIKRNLAPGIIVNANGVLKHTLDVTSPNPILMETIPNAIRPMPTNTAGLNTYQGAQTNLTGSLLALYGSQNSSAPGADTLNPSQGKTPAAINMYSDKEATRDGQERQFLEQAIEQLTDGFYSLIVNIGTESIPVNLFSKDIEEIQRAGMDDVVELFGKNFKLNSTTTGGQLKIDPKSLKDVEYRFNIDTGSTAQMNKQAQIEAVNNLLTQIGKFQNLFKDDPRIEVNWPSIMKVTEELSGIKGANEFIKINDGPSPQEQQLMQQIQQLQQQVQEMQMQQAQKPQDPIVNKAGMFNDPQMAQAADVIHNM